MQKAQESGQWLIENSNESPDVVREVHEKLSSVSTPVELLLARLNERQIKLQSVLMQSEEFDVILGDFERKLNEMATVTKKKKPISALYERVKDQNVQGENLMDDVKQQGIMFEKLMKSGQSVLGSLEDGLDKETLEKRLDEMKEQWQEVKGQVEEWNAKIAKVYPIAEDYKDKVDDFGTWLEGAEKGVEAIEPANVKKTEVRQEMAKIMVCVFLFISFSLSFFRPRIPLVHSFLCLTHVIHSSICLSIGPVGRSIRPSVRRSVGRFVRRLVGSIRRSVHPSVAPSVGRFGTNVRRSVVCSFLCRSFITSIYSFIHSFIMPTSIQVEFKNF